MGPHVPRLASETPNLAGRVQFLQGPLEVLAMKKIIAKVLILMLLFSGSYFGGKLHHKYRTAKKNKMYMVVCKGLDPMVISDMSIVDGAYRGKEAKSKQYIRVPVDTCMLVEASN